ncbi:MAG: alpha-glucan family phosphorylase [Candidatus Velthaea sp.]
MSAPLLTDARVAYFSMEIAVDERYPTYSGGLGVLAGDMLRSAADLGVPLVGMTLAYRSGYFRQSIDESGRQLEAPEPWWPERELAPAGPVVSVRIGDRDVRVAAWRYDVVGVRGNTVPAFLLDTDLDGNHPDDRAITAHLYGGDQRYRLAQETVLGVGGVRMLAALGCHGLETYHMNEGHSALLALALLDRASSTSDPLAAVRQSCVFTTHTPVPAGHDRFNEALVTAVLGEHETERLRYFGLLHGGELNMTYVALRASRHANAVSLRHGEVSRGMFPDFAIGAITNGVHSRTWAAPALARLFDRYVPDWECDSLQLRQAMGIPLADVRAAHLEAKRALVADIQDRAGAQFDPHAFTIGFARRAATYKRASLLFEDMDRLQAIAAQAGRLQIVYGGKAHPHDEYGKAEIRRVHEAKAALGGAVDVVYLENYEMGIAKTIVAGVDLWLNTPRPPEEASGTSGMKAALNGVPSLSTLDGWWVEGCIENRTGWSIEPYGLGALYRNLETAAQLYTKAPQAYAEIMRYAIAVNGSHFSMQRMVQQYVRDVYGAASTRSGDGELERVAV